MYRKETKKKVPYDPKATTAAGTSSTSIFYVVNRQVTVNLGKYNSIEQRTARILNT